MPRLTLRTVAWSQPFVHALADHLLHGRGPSAPPLVEVVVVVPTRASGRRLRQALARRVPDGLFPPAMVPVDWLHTHHLPPAGVASREETTLAWLQVLNQAPAAQLDALAPGRPRPASDEWLLGTADPLAALQLDLAEGDLGFAEVLQTVAGHDALSAGREEARWRALTALEQTVQAHLARLGLRPRAPALRAAAHAAPPPGCAQVIVAGVPNLPRLARASLENLARHLPVEIVLAGPADRATSVADLRDLADWSRGAPADLRAPGIRSVLLPDTAAMHDWVRDLVAGYGERRGLVRVSVPDAGHLPGLIEELARLGQPGLDPAGDPLVATEPGAVAAAWLAALGQSWDEVSALLRLAPVLDRLGRDLDGATPTYLLRALDRLQAAHLATNAAQARAIATAAPAHDLGLALAARVLDWWHAASTAASRLPPAAALREFLRAVYADRRLAPHEPRDARLHDAFSTLNNVLNDAHALEQRFQLAPAVARAWLRRALGRARLGAEFQTDALDLSGWLELGFADQPHIVVAGFVEGAVPESVLGHAFLPDSLRTELGLETNADRHRRDRWLFAQLVASRTAIGGRLDLLVPKRGPDATPLQPSRLLFEDAGDDLVTRARHLFAELEPRRPSPPKSIPWLLQPDPAASAPAALSPSALKRYLACPFRFYLERILKWQAFEPRPLELDAMVFGTLCHHALQTLAEDPAARVSADEAFLGDFLEDALRTRARQLFGATPALVVQLQLTSAASRLRAAAAIEAASRADGWVIEHAEWAWTLQLAPDTTPIRGRIDRIDRHTPTGAVRVIDFKTRDKAEPPAAAHLVPCRRPDSRPWLLPDAVTDDGRCWVDLQLPLYHEAVRRALQPPGEIHLAYLNLAPVREETRLEAWTDYSPATLTAALACARAADEAIRRRRFWPPARLAAPFDDFAALFPDGIPAHVDADAFTAFELPAPLPPTPPAPPPAAPPPAAASAPSATAQLDLPL